MNQYELARLEDRLMALLIDTGIVWFFSAIFVVLLRHIGAALISFFLGLIYQWYFLTANNGQTPGKMLMRIQVVRVDGGPVRDVGAIVRYIGYYLNTAFFMIGWLIAAIDPNRQGLHDRIAGTSVIRR
jgi:uncharacterized RDD family membrane protein YckC